MGILPCEYGWLGRWFSAVGLVGILLLACFSYDFFFIESVSGS
jgi:hypothetical protein